MMALAWLLVAVALVLAGPGAAAGTGRPAGARARRRGDAPDLALPFALELAAAALRAGQPLATALTLAAPAAGATAGLLARTGGLLRLGAEPDEAWAEAAGRRPLAPLARTARRSADSGIRLAAAFEHFAEQARADARGRAQVRAERAGVLAMAPLGLCYLPAFVCLGIVPVVVGITHAVLP